jgi:hypothetical protein
MLQLDQQRPEEVPDGTMMDNPYGYYVGHCYDCDKPQKRLWASNGYFLCKKCLVEKGISVGKF